MVSLQLRAGMERGAPEGNRGSHAIGTRMAQSASGVHQLQKVGKIDSGSGHVVPLNASSIRKELCYICD